MFRISQESKIKEAKLDVKDKKILVLLSEDSRMPISEIAKKIKLSKDTVGYRIKRMVKLSVILKFFPDLNFKKLGYNLFRMFMLVDETDKKRQQELIDALINHKNTLSLMEYSDRWDFELRMIAKSLEDFNNIITEILGKFSDIIIERSELGVIKIYHSILFPYHFHEGIEKTKSIKKEKIEYRPDNEDLKILNSLADNCRLSTYEIAKNTKLSADAVGLRIKKLAKSRIIDQFTILPNLSLLGYSWYTFAVKMDIFSKSCESKFKMFIKDHPYIIKASKTLGNWDLLMYIIAHDPREFHKTIKQIKNEFADTIKHYATFVAYKEHMFNAMPKIINLS